MGFIVLNNGLRVLLEKDKRTSSVNLQFSIAAGAFYPKEQKMGIAHMVEHNIFAKNDKGVCEMEKNINEFGTSVDAFTRDFNTTYSVRTFNEFLLSCFDFLFDAIFKAKFNKTFFEKEKKVIYEEFSKQRNNVMSANAFSAYEKYYEGTFIEKSGFGIGDKKQIYSITFDDMLDFYRENYSLDKTTIIIIGNFDETEILDKIKQKTVGYDSNQPFLIQKEKIDVKKGKEISVINTKAKIPSSCVEIVFSAGLEEKDKCVFDVLSYILCGLSANALLKNRLRTELGYIYMCDATFDDSINYIGCGTFHIRYYVNKNNIEDAIIETFGVIKSLLNGIDDKLLKYALNSAINNLKIKLENIEILSDYHSEKLLYSNQQFIINKKIELYDSISKLDIINAVKNMLCKRKVIAVWGNKINVKKLNLNLNNII